MLKTLKRHFQTTAASVSARLKFTTACFRVASRPHLPPSFGTYYEALKDLRQAQQSAPQVLFQYSWRNYIPADQQDELFYLRHAALTAEDVRRNCALNEAFRKSETAVRSINWFIPYFEHAYAGLYTIFRFAAHLHDRYGIDNRIIVYDNPDADIAYLQSMIQQSFPTLVGNISSCSGKGFEEIPASDVCVATLWTSAYFITQVMNTRAKFYFIQDYEPLFYEAGTIYGLADTTYRLGLLRLVNTPGLLDWIKSLHGGDGTSFVPSVDRQLYHPACPKPSDTQKVRVFFYGRPARPRNGFILGVEALRLVKARYGDRVEIIAAGGEWNPIYYGVGDVLTNLGLLTDLRDVAALYRSCNIGLVFMFTKHPSYQPFEFMASGCCVVTNKNRATQWLLKDGENALLTEPTVESVAEAVGTLIERPALRRELSEKGLLSVPTQSWDAVIDEACRSAGLLDASRQDKVGNGLDSGKK